MADHSNEREDLQSHDLVERLARRLDEPQGVIDVRYAQQKYARIMNWLVERFGLLDQLRTRYGVEDARAGDSQLLMAEQPVLMIEQPAGEQVNYFSTTSQYFPSAMAPQSPSPAVADDAISDDAISYEAQPSSFAEIINARPAPPADESLPPEGTYRVSRRALPLSPAPQAESPGATASQNRHKPVDGLNQSTSAQGTSEPSSDVQTPHALIYAKSVIEREEKLEPHAEAVEWPPVKSETGSAASSPALRQAEIEVVNSERSPVSSLPLVKPQAGPVQIDDHQQSSERQSIETAPTAQDGRRTGVVSEIRDDSLSTAKPDIVWRKSSDGSAADSMGGDAVGRATAAVRQTDSPAPAMAQEAGEGALPAEARASNDEIRIEQLSPQVIRTISERVIRAISFDLKVERERRGRSKWR